MMRSTSARSVARSWRVKKRPRAAAHARSTCVSGSMAAAASTPSAFKNSRRPSSRTTEGASGPGDGGGGAAWACAGGRSPSGIRVWRGSFSFRIGGPYNPRGRAPVKVNRVTMPAPLVLASASPRRRELLAALGVEFTVAPTAVDETAAVAGCAPHDAVLAAALAKVRAAATRHPGATVLAADTIVVADGVVFGKPA